MATKSLMDCLPQHLMHHLQAQPDLDKILALHLPAPLHERTRYHIQHQQVTLHAPDAITHLQLKAQIPTLKSAIQASYPQLKQLVVSMSPSHAWDDNNTR